MNIIVLNGSPKGDLSVTLQYVHFIQKKFPQHELKIIHISKNIKNIERDENAFQEIIDEVRSSDGVLWSFGLWILCVPAQYMRFIELISERGVEDAFKNKYAAVLTTSIHFFDHTAHNYMRAVCEDLNMKYAEALSPEMRDLAEERGREALIIFAENFFEAIEKKTATSRLFKPLTFSDFVYQPSVPEERIDTRGKKAVILTDAYDSDTNLGKMIDRFRQSYSNEIEVIDLNDIDIRGACLGCMRSFFWNHTPSLVGKQMGYIISGPLSQNANLIQILEASSTARQDAIHVDMITDECENSSEIDTQLQSFAERLVSYSINGYIKPQNFLGVGGHKIFRDDIWGRLRMVWQADHRYFKKHGKYDFPQKDYKIRIMTAIMMLLTKIPKFRKKFYANLKKSPAERLKKFIESIK